MKIEFKMDKGFDVFKKALDPVEFKKALDVHIPKANVLNGHIVQKAIRDSIKSGMHHPNAALTIAIKKSSKPLVDTGVGLFQAVSIQKMKGYDMFVGVLRKDGFYDIAVALHEGVQINVTDRMRGLFLVLWKASEGKMPSSSLTGRAADLWKRMPGNWKPLKRSTKAIIIPARPFIAKAFQDQDMRDMVQANWHAAFNAAFKDLANQVP